MKPQTTPKAKQTNYVSPQRRRAAEKKTFVETSDGLDLTESANRKNRFSRRDSFETVSQKKLPSPRFRVSSVKTAVAWPLKCFVCVAPKTVLLSLRLCVSAVKTVLLESLKWLEDVVSKCGLPSPRFRVSAVKNVFAFAFVFLFFWGFSVPLVLAKPSPAPTATATPAPEARALFEKAQNSLHEKRYKDARNSLLELIGKFPVEDVIPKSKVLLAEIEEDFETSLTQLKALAKEYNHQPEGKTALRDLAQRYYLADRYAESADAYKDYLKRYPDQPEEAEIRYWYGTSLMADGHTGEAVSEFDKSIRADGQGPWAPKAYLSLGGAYLKQRKYENAQKQFLKILDQYPRYCEMNQVFLKMGRTYEALNQPKEAHAAYKTLLEKYPKAMEVAEAQERIGELEKADPGLAVTPHLVLWHEPTPLPTITPVSLSAPIKQVRKPEPTVVPTVTPKPRVVSAVVSKAAPQRPFHVQVGVYTVRRFAEGTVKELKKAGYDPTLLTMKGRGASNPIYKVRVGHYADKEQARRAAQLLQRRIKHPTLVVED
jgi:TolA-binding protein